MDLWDSFTNIFSRDGLPETVAPPNKGKGDAANSPLKAAISNDSTPSDDKSVELRSFVENYCLELDNSDFETTIDRLLAEGAELSAADEEGHTVFHSLSCLVREWDQESKESQEVIDRKKLSPVFAYLMEKATQAQFDWNTPDRYGLRPQYLAEAFGYDDLDCFMANDKKMPKYRFKRKALPEDRFAKLAQEDAQLGLFMLAILERKNELPRGKNLFRASHFFVRQVLLHPQAALFLMASEKYSPMLYLADVIIKKGGTLININAQNKQGETPLYAAVKAVATQQRRISLEYIYLLLSLGADPNLADLNEMTPLHLASLAMSQKGNLDKYDFAFRRLMETVLLLMHFKANPNLEDKLSISSMSSLKCWKGYQDLQDTEKEIQNVVKSSYDLVSRANDLGVQLTLQAMYNMSQHLAQYPNNDPAFKYQELEDQLKKALAKKINPPLKKKSSYEEELDWQKRVAHPSWQR